MVSLILQLQWYFIPPNVCDIIWKCQTLVSAPRHQRERKITLHEPSYSHVEQSCRENSSQKKREPIYQTTQATKLTIAAMIKNTLQCLPHALLCKIDAFMPVFGYCRLKAVSCPSGNCQTATQKPLNQKE